LNEKHPNLLEHQATCVWPLAAYLGEGPLWLEAEQCLYFVDVKRRTLQRFRPADGARWQWTLPQMIGWVIPSNHGLLAGLQQGIARLVLPAPLPAHLPAPLSEAGQIDQTVQLEWLHRLHDANSSLRLNDAKADAHGAIWFGTMDDANETNPVGRLYRLAPSGRIELIEGGIACQTARRSAAMAARCTTPIAHCGACMRICLMRAGRCRANGCGANLRRNGAIRMA
jgi:sugar lactone lactonase YvrE